MDFKVGFYEDVPYEEYASIPAYRSHDLTTVIKCPYKWKNELPMKESPALIEGRLQHTLFLEIDKFDDEFVCVELPTIFAALVAPCVLSK